MNREAVLLLGGGRALLMQVAHPSVAAAVAQHSSFGTDPWSRLARTLDVMTRITFGDSTTSDHPARVLGAVHAKVFGTRPDGSRYRADEPDLQLPVGPGHARAVLGGRIHHLSRSAQRRRARRPGVLAFAARPQLELLRLATLGLLAAPLCEAYGYAWGPVREATFRTCAAGVRATVGVLPDALRQVPAASAAA